MKKEKKEKKVIKKITKNIFLILIVFLILGSFFSLFEIGKTKETKIQISQLIQEIENNKIKKIVVKDDTIEILTLDDQTQITYKEPGENFIGLLNDYNVSPDKIKGLTIDIQNTKKSIWPDLLIYALLPLLFIGIFFYYFSRQLRKTIQKTFTFGQVKSFKTNRQENKVAFKDIGGVKEAKQEVREIIDFLKKPKKFTALGAKIPKGVLIVGAPGTGKTLLARAVAGEANVPFFHISGSEFVEMFVGVGASRVRDLFRQAKKKVPCIIFIDELDAVGRIRGGGLYGGHDEREQTLNQILVEMDGFEPNIGLVIIAATNRPDVLDPALLRPGRFDRRIILDIPDIRDREEILKIHCQKKPLVKDVSLRKIAERTPGFSGADLANLMNEAAILAVRQNKKEISMAQILESIEKVLLGPERKSHIISPKEKKITAYHEAGHALVSHLLPHCDPVRKVSIIARGQAAGYTLKMPREDKYLHTRSEFIDDLAALLGGYAAEKIFFGEVTTGASNDLKQTAHLAKKLVTEYGMSEKIGPVAFTQNKGSNFLNQQLINHRQFSEKTAQLIDEEINSLISRAFQQAQKIIQEHRTDLNKIAQLLLKKETLERQEFLQIFKDGKK